MQPQILSQICGTFNKPKFGDVWGPSLYPEKNKKHFSDSILSHVSIYIEYIYFLDLSGYIILGDVYMIKQHTAGHLPTENFKALGSL